MGYVLAALLAWLAALLALYAAYLARREWFESRGLRVYPLVLVVRRRLSLRGGGSRLARIFFTIGVAVLAYNMYVFYETMFASTLLRLAGRLTSPTVTVIIPGVTVSPETFLYMLPGLVLAAAVHEAMHALAARAEGIAVKSTGVALIAGIVPIAFVEPDEEEYSRLQLLGKLRILSAGVYANTILALLLTALLAATPIAYKLVVVGVEKGMPAAQALKPGDVIVYVNGTRVSSLEELRRLIQESSIVNITVERGGRLVSVLIATKEVDGRRMIGVLLRVEPASPVYQVLIWAMLINTWLAVFNAAPLIITDGGKAVTETLRRLLGERGVSLSMAIQLATILLILLNAGIARLG